MLTSLPVEIIARCVEYVAHKKTRDIRAEYFTDNDLFALSRVNHLFYALSAPKLYREITVRGDGDFLAKLVPLFSRAQRRSMLVLVAEAGILITHRAGKLLRASADRIVNPRWVRKLIIFGEDNLFPGEPSLWKFLEEATREIENIEHVVWEPWGESLYLANILRGFTRLTQVTCSANGPMCAPHLKSSFHDIRLKSLTVYCDGTDDGGIEKIGGAGNLLRPSAESLETLHLAFRRTGIINAEEHITGMLKDVKSIKRLKHLRLGFFELSTIIALGKVVKFSALETLQLVHDRFCHGFSDTLIHSGRLSALTTLTVALDPSQVLEVLNACDRLREVYVYYHMYMCEGPVDAELGAKEIVEAVGKHGQTLKVLCLCEEHDGKESAMTMDSDNLTESVSLCPNLEELKISVELGGFPRAASTFSTLKHIKHPDVELYGWDDAPMAECEPEEWIRPLCPPWFTPTNGDDEEEKGPESSITNLDVTLRNLH